MHALLLVAPVLEASIDEVFDQFADSFGALVAFGQAIGFIGSLFYIFYRIWGHWSRAEPFDIYPLLRPFALALCLLCYPFIVKFIVEIGQLLDKGTSTMVASQKAEVERLNQLKKAKVKDNWDKILIPPGEDGEIGTWDVVRTVFGTTGTGNSLVGNAVSGVMQYYFDQFLSWLGEIFYDLSAIYIKLISTFFLIVLALTGPITFGLAMFDWFYSGLAAWFSRMIHILLYIPLVNILGAILETIHVSMLNQDLAVFDEQLRSGNTGMGSADWGLIIFYFIGAGAYLSIPKLASYVIESTGVGDAIGSATQPTTMLAGAATGQAAGAGAASLGRTAAGAFSSSNAQPATNNI
ncbi:conjugative transposon protein TraJ [Spirosoma knui]